MAQVKVGPRRIWIRTADGVIARVYTAFIKADAYSGNLQDCPGIKESSLDVRFNRILWDLRIPLIERVENGILQFLQEFSNKIDPQFDCYAFVNLVHGLPLRDKRYLLRDWTLEAQFLEPAVGSTVFLLTCEENHFHHAAIYLGSGLYVSVYGAGGNLEIATLPDMVRTFRSKDVVIGTPLPHYH